MKPLSFDPHQFFKTDSERIKKTATLLSGQSAATARMMKKKRERQSVLVFNARERHAKKTELFTLRIEPRLLEELFLLSDEHFSVSRHVRIAIQEYLSIRRDAIDRAREERKKSQSENT